MIEDALRDTFAAKSAATPSAPPGLADLAIRRAAVTRRRQVVVTAAAGVATVVAAGALVVNILPSVDTVPAGDTSSSTSRVAAGVSPSTVTSEPPAAGSVEVIVGDEVYAEGKAKLKFHPKAALGTVSRVFRATDDSYLVITKPSQSTRSLLLFDRAGRQSTVVVESASYIAVSADGDQVAWSAEGKMSVADRVREQLRNASTVTAPVDGGPIGFLGRHVILGRTRGSGVVEAFDVWYAGRGYAMTWSTNVLRLFGPLPGGTGLVAQVAPENGEKESCLAVLSPDQPFNVERRACGLPAPMSEGGAISPDGRWLVYPPAIGGTGLVLVDLRTVFGNAKVAGSWQLPAAPIAMVWLSPETLVIDAGGQVLRAVPGRFDRVSTVMTSTKGSVLIEPFER